jgi:hypothetical protein
MFCSIIKYYVIKSKGKIFPSNSFSFLQLTGSFQQTKQYDNTYTSQNVMDQIFYKISSREIIVALQHFKEKKTTLI